MPHETGEIRHQLLNDLETHALYVGVLAFVALVGILLTYLAVVDHRARARARRAADQARALEAAARCAGVEEGFRRGWHG